MDSSIPEEDFWDGLKCDIPIIAFKHISINRDDNSLPTRIVELKFLANKIPIWLSIYNIIFEISSSVRSPVQCNKCLRFSYTSKYCRSSPRCSHCDKSNHSIESCPSVQTSDPRCLFCQLPHLATDRRCQEWDLQRDIKKIIATENITFRETIVFKKQNQSTAAFSYSRIVNKVQKVTSFKASSPIYSNPLLLSPSWFVFDDSFECIFQSIDIVCNLFNCVRQFQSTNCDKSIVLTVIL